MKAVLLVVVVVVVVVVGEREEEAHSRHKRQLGSQGGFGLNFGSPGVSANRPFSSPQKFIRDPVTGQYVRDVDRDAFGIPIDNFQGGSVPGGGFQGGSVPGGGFQLGTAPGGGFQGGSIPGGGFQGGSVPGGGFQLGTAPGGGFQGGSVPGGGFQGGSAPGIGFQGGNVPEELLFQLFQQLQQGQIQQPQTQPQQPPQQQGQDLVNAPDVSAFARLNVARGQPNVPYQECVTPRNQAGRCRHLQYCILPEFRQNYNVFLAHVCPIQGRYVGVCCPQQTPAPTPAPTPRPTPAPTPAPTSAASIGCGRSAQTSTRIVGGVATNPGEFPWMVSILRRDASPNQYCAGVLISNRHVLTAAHCLAGFDWSGIWVRVGEHDFNQQGESPSVNLRIADFRLHKDFDSRTFTNDIALLVLQQPVQYSRYVRPICLPPPNEKFTGDMVTIAGWGAVKYQGAVSPVLRKVDLPVWKNKDCDDAYDQPIRDSMICAGYPQGGRDACQDDSGGPMMALVNGRWSVLGLVSFGTRCAEPGIPGVYTRVNSFLGWINNNV